MIRRYLRAEIGFRIDVMVRHVTMRLLWVLVLACIPVFAQEAQKPDAPLPDAPAPQQQPEAQPPQNPPAPEPSQSPEKKPESKIKKKLKRGAPNCIHIGGLEKCKSSNDEDEENSDEQPAQQPPVPESQPLPRSADKNISSSKDSEISLTPPPGEEGRAPSDVREVRPYNPHKADKDVEVGDFYFKRDNYRAAESRYAEALQYMPNHAEATFKLAEAEEKLGKTLQARQYYEKYLKILPKGEFAEKAKQALARLDPQAKDATSPRAQNHR